MPCPGPGPPGAGDLQERGPCLAPDLGVYQHGPVGAVRIELQRREREVGFHPPQERRAGVRGGAPVLPVIKVAVGEAQSVFRQVRVELARRLTGKHARNRVRYPARLLGSLTVFACTLQSRVRSEGRTRTLSGRPRPRAQPCQRITRRTAWLSRPPCRSQEREGRQYDGYSSENADREDERPPQRKTLRLVVLVI